MSQSSGLRVGRVVVVVVVVVGGGICCFQLGLFECQFQISVNNRLSYLRIALRQTKHVNAAAAQRCSAPT